MRGTKYIFHKDSKGDLNSLFEMEQDIDQYFSRSPIFKLSRKKALREVLTIHSELTFMHVIGGTKAISDFSFDLDDRNNEVMIQESLKWALRLIHKFCKEESEGKVINPSRKEIMDFLVHCYKFDLFKNMLFSAGKGGYIINLNDSKITFISSKEEGDFLAYNAWRQALREREQFNSIKNNSREALQEVHLNEFSMPEEWNLGSYTLGQFKEVSMRLDKLISTWFLNHHKHLEASLVIGKYKATEVVKINHKNWWIDQLVRLTSLHPTIVENIIDDMTYENFNNNDPSYQFFIPLSNGELALPVGFAANFVRYERNLMALLPKRNQKLFSQLTNDCENQQINIIKESLKDFNIVTLEKQTKAQDKRKGIDLMVLDPESLELLVIELKWRVPPSSTREMYTTDEAVMKGLQQIQEAENWVNVNLNTVLSDYLGKEYFHLNPSHQSYCVVVNENIGTGDHCNSSVPVITLDHLIELLRKGIKSTINTLENGEHRVPREYINIKPISFDLFGYRIEFPTTELLGTWLDKTLPEKRTRWFH
ncbi:hypothetical protein [Paenibacillus gorillae]|uniref:hypothetical protein n=1 Tax=Paenibacillus gorillae TaxID=1243662 RepID=UPI0004AE27CE|nr:hypothetical protein [Paenibacillus gorillae]